MFSLKQKQSFYQKMEANDVAMKSILNCRELLVVVIKSDGEETFIMG